MKLPRPAFALAVYRALRRTLFFVVYLEWVLRPARWVRRRLLHNSIFMIQDELFMASLQCPMIIAEAVAWARPRTVLDLGCGTGRSLDRFLEMGIDVTGVEGSAAAIAKSRHPEHIMRFNLEKELNLKKRFDLVFSFEFVEHIHPRYVENLMKTFSNHSDKIVLSAAPPGQGGEGHFNEQPSEYWISLFERCGYSLVADVTARLRALPEEYARNMLAFEKCPG